MSRHPQVQAWALCNPDPSGWEEPVMEFSGKQWQMQQPLSLQKCISVIQTGLSGWYTRN